jgi:hypothetical protein
MPEGQIQIIDPYLREQVEQERKRCGETTLAKTVRRLLTERLREVEIERRQARERATATAAAA